MPHVGDSATRTAERRQAVIEYMNSKSATPFNSSRGNDLNRFPFYCMGSSAAPTAKIRDIRYDAQGNAYKQGPNGKAVRVK